MNPCDLVDFLLDRLNTHVRCGLLLNVHAWLYVTKQRFDTVIDGVIVGVQRVSYVDIIPDCTYRCGSCYEIQATNILQNAYFNYNQGHIICPSCARRLTVDPPYPMVQVCWYEDVTDLFRYMESIDANIPVRRVKTLTIEHAYYKELDRARDIAITTGKKFFGGALSVDIWHDILARRVIRRFRRYTHRRKTAHVIHLKTGLHKEDVSMMLRSLTL